MTLRRFGKIFKHDDLDMANDYQRKKHAKKTKKNLSIR